MELQIIDNEKATYIKNGTTHEINLGKIDYNSDATIKLKATSNKPLKSMVLFSSCSCTLAEVESTDEGIFMSAKYKNTNIKGMFSKTITLTFIENGTKKKEFLKLKGNVV